MSIEKENKRTLFESCRSFDRSKEEEEENEYLITKG